MGLKIFFAVMFLWFAAVYVFCATTKKEYHHKLFCYTVYQLHDAENFEWVVPIEVDENRPYKPADFFSSGSCWCRATRT